MVNAPDQVKEPEAKSSETMSSEDRTKPIDKKENSKASENASDKDLGNVTDDLGRLGLEKDTIPGKEKGLVPGLESGTVQLPDLPDLGTGPPNETRHGVRNLRSWLNKNIKVEISDGRFLVGTFLCTDRDGNVIIGLCNEYTRDPDLMYSQGDQELKGRETGDKENAPNPAQSSADGLNSRLAGTEATADSSKGCEADLNTVDEGRILGLAMVPGRHIKKLYIDESPFFPTSSRLHHNSGSGESCQST